MRGGTPATPPRPSLSAAPASSQDAGSGDTPREREETEQTGLGPGAGAGATGLHGGAGAHRHGLGCQAGPRDPSGPQLRSTGHSRAAGKGAPQRVLRGVEGRRGRNVSWTRVLHPGGSLSYPASVCLPMEWAPAGDSGDRGARRRPGAGCVASLGLAVQWAATCRRPPTSAAPGHGS